LASKTHAANVLINFSGELTGIKGEYDAALNYSLEALKFKEIGDKQGTRYLSCPITWAVTLLQTSVTLKSSRLPPPESLNISPEPANKQGIASCFSNPGKVSPTGKGKRRPGRRNYWQNPGYTAS